MPETGADAVYETIAADRNSYGRMVLLLGDSIPKGFALGQAAETVPETAPLYPFASIRAMANWALDLNGRIPHTIFAYGGSFANANGSLLPNIEARVKAGIIRSGDIVIVSDAGDHSMDPDAYEAWWREIRRVITERHDITLVMMSMFDYCHDNNMACGIDFQYDRVFGSRTMNQATKAAAEADLGYVGQTIWIDMNAIMDQWRASAQAADGIDVILPDGVHPNVWGQMKMAGLYLKIARERPYLTSVQTIKDFAAANVSLLQYGVAGFTSGRAAEYVEALLKQ